MLSIARRTPASQSRIPKARYHRTNEALRSGARLGSRCDPQISAARWGDVATKVPSAIATVLTNRFVAIASTTKGRDKCYRFLLIDVDPIKLTGEVATEEEVRYATATRDEVVKWLTANGMTPALITFTGSGYHVFVKVDCWPVGIAPDWRPTTFRCLAQPA